MSEQPEDSLYGVPITLTSPTLEEAYPAELTIVPYATPESQLVQSGDTLTIGAPDGDAYEVKVLSAKPDKGPNGEYMETCKIGTVKTTRPGPTDSFG